MKLFTCASIAFAAVSAQADYSSYYDSGEASDYIDAYYGGNSTDMIDERRKTQEEKDAAKANRQKNKNKNKYNYTEPPTTKAPTTTEYYPTTTTSTTTTSTTTSTTTTTTTTSTTTTTDSYEEPTDGYETNPQNPYALGGGDSDSANAYGTTTTEVITIKDETTGYVTVEPVTDAPELLVCWTCDGATPEECLANGENVTCQENQGSCQLEVRKREQEDGSVAFVEYRTGCKQKRACRNNQKQNFVGGNKDHTQCRPEEDLGYDHSVCRQCCYEDNCVSDGATFWLPVKRGEWKKNMAQSGNDNGGGNPYGGGVPVDNDDDDVTVKPQY